MKYKGQEYRVDWRHVGNTFYMLEDAVGWFYLLLALLIIVSAPSLATAALLVACVAFKAWAVNWERKYYL